MCDALSEDPITVGKRLLSGGGSEYGGLDFLLRFLGLEVLASSSRWKFLFRLQSGTEAAVNHSSPPEDLARAINWSSKSSHVVSSGQR